MLKPVPWRLRGWPLATALVALVAVYYLAGKVGLALAFVNASASPVWAPTGIALAAFLLLGARAGPAILLGAFLVNWTTTGSVASSIAIGTGNTLEGLLGAALLRRFADGAAVFTRPRSIVRFVLLGAGIAPTVSATFGATSLAAAGFARWGDYAAIWVTWWLGDATGALVVTPVLLLWALERGPRWKRARMLEALGLAGGLLLTSLVGFGGWTLAGWSINPLVSFLCFPFPLWIAFRFGRREVSAVTLLLSGVAIWGTLHGFGPFVRPSPNESLIFLQAFMGLLSVTALATAAIVDERNRVEQALRAEHDALGRSVAEQTRSLSEAVEALGREVRERRRAEEQLRESELRLRGLLEAVPDAMVIVDRDGTIRQVSAQAESLLGFAREEMVGRSVEMLVPERLRDRHGTHRLAFSEDPRTRPMGAGQELHAVRRDGTEFPVEISLSPVRTETGLLVMAAIRDITERKRVDEQVRRLNLDLERRVQERTAQLERSNEALRQFAYAVSHDLQEPLRTVSNYAQLLSRRYAGRLDAEADEMIGFVVDGSQWMHQMLRDLLAYSRVDTQPRPTPTQMADLGESLSLALENLHAAIDETGASISRDGPLPVVHADSVQMVQLFQNLVGNAIKFRRPGLAPRVRVGSEGRDGEWILRVSDNGIGLDRRHSERIFGVFQRLHQRDEYPGTGIGLAICRKIVERLGGRIWVDAEPGAGSTFWFTLPRRTMAPP